MTASRKNERREARYRKGKAAEAEVLRRLSLALDRLNVASQGDGGNPAQFLHAMHYIQRGYADDSRTVPREAPYLEITHSHAEDVALAILTLLTWARNSKHTVAEADR